MRYPRLIVQSFLWIDFISLLEFGFLTLIHSQIISLLSIFIKINSIYEKIIIKLKLKEKISKSESFRCFVLIFSFFLKNFFQTHLLNLSESFDDLLTIFHFRWTNYLLHFLPFQLWVIWPSFSSFFFFFFFFSWMVIVKCWKEYFRIRWIGRKFLIEMRWLVIIFIMIFIDVHKHHLINFWILESR